MADAAPLIHPTAIVEPGARVGAGTQIWHFSHVRAGAVLGEACNVGFACYVDATLGARCRVQNHVSLFPGVTLGDDVFVGPGVMFTNVKRPRARVPPTDGVRAWVPTKVGHGASLGAGAVVVCGVTIGAYAMIGAGATVTRDVPAHALVVGTPARVVGYVCQCGAPSDANPPHRCGGCHAAIT